MDNKIKSINDWTFGEEDFDFSSRDDIAKFILSYIERSKTVYSLVSSFRGYPGGVAEHIFNEDEVRGILNLAIVGTLRYFEKDLTKKRIALTIIGVFTLISKNEMIDVYNMNFKRDKRTIDEEGAFVSPRFSSIEDSIIEDTKINVVELLHVKKIKETLRELILEFSELDQNVLNMYLGGYQAQEIAEKLGITARDVTSIMFRLKRRIAKSGELEGLCA